MKVYSKWLRHYIALPSQANTILDRLTHAGLEVEAVYERNLDTTYLRIAQIQEIQKHPNADRLSVCDVLARDGKYSVVCGAHNFSKGDKVLLALPGAQLKHGLTIQKSKIRGVASDGMLCSGSELGFEAESDGILILPNATPLTSDLRKVLNLGEFSFELNITPNRPDCMNHIGIARELSALLKKPLQFPKIKIKEIQKKTKDIFKVKIQDPKKCLRYMGRTILDVKIEPSPAWLCEYLSAVGQRPINNVVDITNYVLLEMGQPLHAFDADKIEGQTIIVRPAQSHETMVTLDGQTRNLETTDIVISDLKKSIALGGVMGGETSEVSQTTQNIFLESAYFDPATIRKTAKRLGLSSESSKRFERGVDIHGVYVALERATQLLIEIAGGKVTQKPIDVYPKKIKSKIVSVTQDKLTQYLGYFVPLSTVKSLLLPLGFKIIPSSSRGQSLRDLTVSVPSYRVDIFEDVDLIEEVARLLGYDKIPTLEPKGTLNLEQKIESSFSLENKVADVFKAQGLHETVHLSFQSEEDLKIFGKEKGVTALQNPLGKDTALMRTSLLPGLIQNVKRNGRIFEIGNVFYAKGHQEKWISGLISGQKNPIHWAVAEANVDFFDLKAIVQAFFGAFLIEGVLYQRTPSVPGYYHPGVSCEMILGGKQLGWMGKLHPDLKTKFDFDQDLYCFELQFEVLEDRLKHTPRLKPISKYPAVKRDISILVPKSVSCATIQATIQKTAGDLLQSLSLFDLYEGENIPKDAKSLAFALTYQSKEKTLTDTEIQALHLKVCEALTKTCQAQIR